MNHSGNHNSDAASTITYIGIGSNLNQPIQQVLTALQSLARLPNSRLLAQSSLYRSYALKVPESSDTDPIDPDSTTSDSIVPVPAKSAPANRVPVPGIVPVPAKVFPADIPAKDTADKSPKAQDDYINAVAKLETRLPAEQLLLELQAIEQSHGRIRKQRWEPRPLDLDILLYGDQTIATDTLSVPHPEISKRHFVLYPLAEIAPELIMPSNIRLTDLLTQCPMDELVIVELASETTSDTAPSAGE